MIEGENMRKVEVSTLESHLFWNRDYTANKDTQQILHDL